MKKWILTTMVLAAAAFAARAQYETTNHDSPKMNQITVAEIGTGTLEPDAYYWLLHNNYRQTASSKNKLSYRTEAGVASYQQVDMAETIDSALTKRAGIEALNLADREVDLAWLAEGDKIETQMQRFQKNVDRILTAGGTVDEWERWNEYRQVYQCAVTAIREADMPNAQRKQEYLQIYADLTRQNDTLVRYIVQVSSSDTVGKLLSCTGGHTVDKKSIAREASGRWKDSGTSGNGSLGGSGGGDYDGEETVNR